MKLFGSEKKEIKSKKNEFLMKSGYGESGYGKGISKEGMGSNSKDLVSSEIIEVKNVNPLKFDGLFLEISEYNNELKDDIMARTNGLYQKLCLYLVEHK